MTDFKTATINRSVTPPLPKLKGRRSPKKPQLCSDSKMGLRSLVDGFLLECKATDKSLETVAYYSEKLGKFLWFANECGLLEKALDITSDHIRAFLAHARRTSSHR